MVREPAVQSSPAAGVSGRGPRAGVVAAVLALSAAGPSGCASAPIDYAKAVRLRVVNPTPMRVWIEFERSAGGAYWLRSIGPRVDRQFVIRHRAFGDGRIKLRLIRWPRARHLTRVYRHRGSFVVPPGSRMLLELRRDLRTSTLRMAPGSHGGRPTASGEDSTRPGARPGSGMLRAVSPAPGLRCWSVPRCAWWPSASRPGPRAP